MNIEIIKKQAGAFLASNGATVLTVGGVIGTVSTAVLAARASLKAQESLQKQREDWNDKHDKYLLEHDGVGGIEPLKQTDKLMVTAPHYVVPVITGTLTVGCIVGANMVSARKAAALATAYALTDERFKEYREKVSTKLTGPKQQAVLDEIAQDHVDANPPGKEVVIITEGDVLCYDNITGRYFQSTVEKIKRAELDIKETLYHHNSASLSDFHSRIGLKPTTYTQEVGWNIDNAIEVIFSTTMAEDRPCVTIDFAVLPKPDYHRNF